MRNERETEKKKSEDEGRGPHPAAAKTAVEPPKRQVPLLGVSGEDSLSTDPFLSLLQPHQMRETTQGKAHRGNSAPILTLTAADSSSIPAGNWIPLVLHTSHLVEMTDSWDRYISFWQILA